MASKVLDKFKLDSFSLKDLRSSIQHNLLMLTFTLVLMAVATQVAAKTSSAPVKGKKLPNSAWNVGNSASAPVVLPTVEGLDMPPGHVQWAHYIEGQPSGKDNIHCTWETMWEAGIVNFRVKVSTDSGTTWEYAKDADGNDIVIKGEGADGIGGQYSADVSVSQIGNYYLVVEAEDDDGNRENTGQVATVNVRARDLSEEPESLAFPNPTNNEINQPIAKEGQYTANLFTINGKLVYSEDFVTEQDGQVVTFQPSGQNCRPGQYVLVIEDRGTRGDNPVESQLITIGGGGN